ncbi:MAG: DUF6683 family protein [Acidobacteriota bacterium]
MFDKKVFRLLQILGVVLIFSSLIFPQVSGGGSMNQGATGGGSMGGSLSGQLGGILNKNVFARTIKKNSTKSNAAKSNKNSVSKPSNTVAKNKSVTRPTAKTPAPTSEAEYEDLNLDAIKYQPIGNTRFDQEFANMITQNPDEKAALLIVFAETKKAYNAEAKKLGRPNDLALVFTFFISACLTVYHDAPEPTEEATENLYQVIAQSLSESPETAQMSNSDKNLTAEKLIYITGVIYAGYLSSKQTQDVETLKIYRQTAGVCLETLIGISAESIEFDKNGLKIRS